MAGEEDAGARDGIGDGRQQSGPAAEQSTEGRLAEPPWEDAADRLLNAAQLMGRGSPCRGSPGTLHGGRHSGQPGLRVEGEPLALET